MFPTEKLDMVRIYLRAKCPDYAMEDHYDSERISQTFQLTHKDRIPLVIVSKSFFDKHSTAEILLRLIDDHLDRRLESNMKGRIIITDEGILEDS
jgi:hypothetical protein